MGDKDISTLLEPVELQVVYDAPPAINHSCIEEFLSLNTEEATEEELLPLWNKYAARPAYEGISSSANGVSAELMGKLSSLIGTVKRAELVDYHPGTHNIVRDIVHPSLYPFIANVSTLAEGVNQEELMARDEQTDMWSRPYETSVYQWLPAEVSVSAQGKCKFTSYINNLSQERYSELYAALEELLSTCLPHFEACVSYAKAVEFLPEDAEDVELYQDCRVPPHGDLQTQDLSSRNLQVIVKIVDYEVPPGGTHEGVWHVEGMSHENIIATAELILQKDSALVGADLEFKRAFTIDEARTIYSNVAQCRSKAVEEFISTCMVPMGRLGLACGKLAAWPNSHVHRITPLKNSDESSTALRRIVVFWLVNPERRIISTASVPQQQGRMPLETALQHRLELMEERKRHKQDWNVREISLCEH